MLWLTVILLLLSYAKASPCDYSVAWSTSPGTKPDSTQFVIQLSGTTSGPDANQLLNYTSIIQIIQFVTCHCKNDPLFYQYCQTKPTGIPTHLPTTKRPSRRSKKPTMKPTTKKPTKYPTKQPTVSPTTVSPTTSSPTLSPTFEYEYEYETNQPSTSPITTSSKPTKIPVTSTPTTSPSTTESPSSSPEFTTSQPTGSPNFMPTTSPMNFPTTSPVTDTPTAEPISTRPTTSPITTKPTHSPSALITKEPTKPPSFVSPTTSPTQPFTIDMVLMTGDLQVATYQTAVLSAAAKWSAVITKDYPTSFDLATGPTPCGFNIDQSYHVENVLVFVQSVSIDGGGNILARAGTCAYDSNGFPRIGLIQFDSADLDYIYQTGKLYSVTLHELGHTLGIGTKWGGLVDTSTYTYKGTQGNLGNTLVGGTGPALVENTGGAGTKGAHWRESTYGDELMTGWASPAGRPMPLSVMTIMSMRDYGLQVDPSKADAYMIPTSTPTKLPTSTPTKLPTKSPTTTPSKSPTGTVLNPPRLLRKNHEKREQYCSETIDFGHQVIETKQKKRHG